MSGLHNPPLGESDTRSKLIDPAIHARGWTEEQIRREETAGAIEIIDGKPRRRSKGRVDYTLRVKILTGNQPVALGVIEAKAENLPPGHGLEQAKSYARCKRLNVPFAFSSIEDAVYDLKAVNPNKQAEEDTRTPAELLDTIEAKGREVADALAVLRSL